MPDRRPGLGQVPDPAVPGRGSGLMLVGRMIDQMDVHLRRSLRARPVAPAAPW